MNRLIPSVSVVRIVAATIAFGLTSAVAGDIDNVDSLLTFGQRPAQSERELRDVWMKRPVELRKKIFQFLAINAGLSSTGNIALIGIYAGPLEHQQMFHFQQVDLFGNRRLFWSVLVSPDTMQARILYHVDDKKIKADWIAIE
jgi:hypothetical protein